MILNSDFLFSSYFKKFVSKFEALPDTSDGLFVCVSCVSVLKEDIGRIDLKVAIFPWLLFFSQKC